MGKKKGQPTIKELFQRIDQHNRINRRNVPAQGPSLNQNADEDDEVQFIAEVNPNVAENNQIPDDEVMIIEEGHRDVGEANGLLVEEDVEGVEPPKAEDRVDREQPSSEEDYEIPRKKSRQSKEEDEDVWEEWENKDEIPLNFQYDPSSDEDCGRLKRIGIEDVEESVTGSEGDWANSEQKEEEGTETEANLEGDVNHDSDSEEENLSATGSSDDWTTASSDSDDDFVAVKPSSSRQCGTKNKAKKNESNKEEVSRRRNVLDAEDIVTIEDVFDAEDPDMSRAIKAYNREVERDVFPRDIRRVRTSLGPWLVFNMIRPLETKEIEKIFLEWGSNADASKLEWRCTMRGDKKGLFQYFYIRKNSRPRSALAVLTDTMQNTGNGKMTERRVALQRLAASKNHSREKYRAKLRALRKILKFHTYGALAVSAKEMKKMKGKDRFEIIRSAMNGTIEGYFYFGSFRPQFPKQNGGIAPYHLIGKTKVGTTVSCLRTFKKQHGGEIFQLFSVKMKNKRQSLRFESYLMALWVALSWKQPKIKLLNQLLNLRSEADECDILKCDEFKAAVLRGFRGVEHLFNFVEKLPDFEEVEYDLNQTLSFLPINITSIIRTDGFKDSPEAVEKSEFFRYLLLLIKQKDLPKDLKISKKGNITKEEKERIIALIENGSLDVWMYVGQYANGEKRKCNRKGVSKSHKDGLSSAAKFADKHDCLTFLLQSIPCSNDQDKKDLETLDILRVAKTAEVNERVFMVNCTTGTNFNPEQVVEQFEHISQNHEMEDFVRFNIEGHNRELPFQVHLQPWMK